MRTLCFLGAALLAMATPLAAAAHESSLKIEGPADAYVYELAPPGSYDLPRIGKAADARLLDEDGETVELGDLFKGRLTLLTFMYLRCGDVCPIAATRMADLQLLAAEDPALARQLQLISLSFDPAHDTPARMAEHGRAMRLPDPAAPDWLFLTAESQAAIAPVLKAYNQPVGRKADPDDPSGPLAHLLRAFLVDGEGYIRNIYSADFLDPRLLLNDLKTLQMEAH
ncbi:SCO family protein [Pelagibius marinus]|uniref:SCO family protein n=1 Tax=Pelagibius marinus TaxID=2762760 RepID=UPI001D053CA0|nr:SCO family protein [Pelagibius marinus]